MALLTDTIWPLSELSSDPTSLLEKIKGSLHPVFLTQEGQDVAVVVDIESYQNLLDEVALLRDMQKGLADVEAGRVIPQDEVRALLQKRYAQ